jgi:SAM-dependent methyltransferase
MTTTQPTAIDTARMEAFGERMLGLINDSYAGLAVSVGHRTGLFDVLSTLSWATSNDIAANAGLNERYVREWLAVMVTGGIIDYRSADSTYLLPPEHAAFTTTAAGPDNLAPFTQYLALFGKVEDEIIECFRNGGGLPYARFSRFQELMREESGAVVDAALLETILPLVPGLTDRLAAGIDVADIGCGSGHAINVMARAFPNSRFTGYDFSSEAIAAGRREASEWGLTNATFEECDVAALDKQAAFDFILAFDAIHDQAAPRKVLANIRKALRPTGVFLMIDIAGTSDLEQDGTNPIGPMLYACSLFHCMTVSLALDGEGLGTMWGEPKARELLAEAGFTRVDVQRIEDDIQNAYFVARP